MHDNRGMGTVEIILVLTVLIIFVLVCRDRIVDSAVSLCREFIEDSRTIQKKHEKGGRLLWSKKYHWRELIT